MNLSNYGDVTCCHICGLRIPMELVDTRHPLFGTIDHVIPRSANGKDSPENRAPAHLMCNGKKGSAMLSDNMRDECRADVMRVASEYGYVIAGVDILDTPHLWRAASEQQEAIKTMRIVGMPPSEIAKRLGIRQKAVRRGISTMRKKVRGESLSGAANGYRCVWLGEDEITMEGTIEVTSEVAS